VDFKGKRVLVTGAAGFIGTTLSDRLQKEGAAVFRVIRDLSLPFVLGTKETGTSLIGDVCDFDFVRRSISENEIDVVYHLAANAIVRTSARDPVTTYQTNVMGTVSVLEACRVVGRCESIVVASSDKAYGDHSSLPYREDHPLLPKNTYDTSKACMDMIARSYAYNYDMPVVVSRCSNVYGPGDMNLSRIVPNTIRRILDGKAPLLYSDIENMEREFIYIDDVVDAYAMLADVAPLDAGSAYNIGGTGPVRIRDLVKLICQKMGKPDMEPEIIQRDPLFREIQRQYIDADKLSRATGWFPRVELVKGIERTVWSYGRLFTWGKS
jgi:CDP-glucose 4,6-dehydratase